MLPEDVRKLSEVNRDSFRKEFLSNLLNNSDFKTKIMDKIINSAKNGEFEVYIVGNDYEKIKDFEFDNLNLGAILVRLGYAVEVVKPNTPGHYGIRISWK